MLPGRSKTKITPLDFFLLGLLGLAIGFVTYRITVKLNYSWHWEVIPQYIIRYDQESDRWVSNYLLLGMLTTFKLSVWGSVLALAFGLLAALARTGNSLLGRMLSRSYVELMRNLPPLVIIFIFYFFLADQIIPLLGFDVAMEKPSSSIRSFLSFFLADPDSLSPFLAALFTLAVFEGAYVAEIIRSGIKAVDTNQWEAAHALGLTRYHTMRHIILPQALRQVLPPLAGQLISLIKDSAIVSVISIQELTYQGTQLMASTYLTIEVWITIALMYMFMTFPCSMLVSRLEKRFAR